jgi:hypothetical protein
MVKTIDENISRVLGVNWSHFLETFLFFLGEKVPYFLSPFYFIFFGTCMEVNIQHRGLQGGWNLVGCVKCEKKKTVPNQ